MGGSGSCSEHDYSVLVKNIFLSLLMYIISTSFPFSFLSNLFLFFSCLFVCHCSLSLLLSLSLFLSPCLYICLFLSLSLCLAFSLSLSSSFSLSLSLSRSFYLSPSLSIPRRLPPTRPPWASDYENWMQKIKKNTPKYLFRVISS